MPTNDLTVTYNLVDPFQFPDQAESIWLTLQERSEHSYFLSWGWISTWLRCLPTNCDVKLVVGSAEGKEILCFFIGSRTGVEHKIVYARRAYLNCTGNRDLDELSLEYNGILMDRQYPQTSMDFVTIPAFKPIDEFQCPALTQSNLNLLTAHVGDAAKIETESIPSYYVDLAHLRKNDIDYLDLISKNRRAQVRRSIATYEKASEIQLKIASSEVEALAMLGELAKLHQSEWEKRGEKGMFAYPFFSRFLQELVRQRFSSGEIEIAHVFNSKETIGYLYNFRYENNILFYQSGFNYKPGNNYRPGLVCHYLAILHYASLGLSTYDFLAGDNQFKKSLATHSNNLYWLRIRRHKLRFTIEDALRKIKTRLARSKRS